MLMSNIDRIGTLCQYKCKQSVYRMLSTRLILFCLNSKIILYTYCEWVHANIEHSNWTANKDDSILLFLSFTFHQSFNFKWKLQNLLILFQRKCKLHIVILRTQMKTIPLLKLYILWFIQRSALLQLLIFKRLNIFCRHFFNGLLILHILTDFCEF